MADLLLKWRACIGLAPVWIAFITILECDWRYKMRTPEYQKVVDSYPVTSAGVYGEWKGEALKTLEEYNDLYVHPCLDRMSDDEIRNRIARKKAIDEDSEIANQLTHAVNSGSPEKVAKALYLGLCNQHRTLQAKAIKALLELLKLYKDSDYDLRNHAAVVEAALVTEFLDREGFGIPLI